MRCDGFALGAAQPLRLWGWRPRRPRKPEPAGGRAGKGGAAREAGDEGRAGIKLLNLTPSDRERAACGSGVEVASGVEGGFCKNRVR